MSARVLLLLLFFVTPLFASGWGGSESTAKRLETNQVVIHSPPAWLTESRVTAAAGKVESYLEWDIRKVPVYWYSDQAAFERAHKLGPHVLAGTDRNKLLIHVGPRVTKENFDAVFGHELTHVIVLQKYKNAIPAWLEEGLANFIARPGSVDYAFLASKPVPQDVTKLSHPFRDPMGWRYHYQASQALMEMIAKKCNIKDLLRLSVGKKIETYLKTYCELTDLNAEFRKWIEQHTS